MTKTRLLKTTSSVVIGERLRRRRVDRGWRQEDVAAEMRVSLHPWERVTVAAVEAGTRSLSQTEQAALAGVFRRSWVDFLALEGTDRTLELDGDTWDITEIAVETTPGMWVRWPSLLDSLRHGAELSAGGVGGPGPDQAQALAQPDETDRKAARSLNVSPVRVREVALARWGRSLAQERDHRISQLRGPARTPRSVQAQRGHMTRALVGELAFELNRGAQVDIEPNLRSHDVTSEEDE